MRRSTLPSFVLALVALSCLASAQSSIGSTTATTIAPNTTAPTYAPLPKTQCEICHDTGECSNAYYGAPGQDYHSWLDAFDTLNVCCCPVSATCSPYDNMHQCKCDQNDGNADSSSSFSWMWVGLCLAILAGLVVSRAIWTRRVQQRN